MNALLSLARLLLVFLSFAGYALLLSRRFLVQSEFLPVLCFSSVSVLLFVGGLLNLLLPAALLLFIGGLVLLVAALIRKRPDRAELRSLFSPGLIVFLLLCAWFVLFLRSAGLYAYDDFSHWGLIAKSMLTENRFPSSAEIVTFPTYPPGSAVFLYYMGLLLGEGENKLLMAQMFLQSACACSLFALAGRGRRAVLPSLLAGGAALLMLTSFQQALSTLLVDTLLPLMALANTVLLLRLRDDPRRAALLSVPLCAMTILIKNNGLFFAALNLILLLILVLRRRKEGGRPLLISAAVGLLLPLLLFGGWKLHLSLTFPPEAQSGHHAMNIENYLKNYQEKSPELKAQIGQNFRKAAFDPNTRNSKTMLSLTAAGLLLLLLSRVGFGKRLSGLALALLAADAAYLLYLLGIWLMYLFSMPASEAASFVSFNRYGVSIVIYAVGLVTAGLLLDLEGDFSRPALRLGAACGFLVCLCWCMNFSHTLETLTVRPAYETTRPYRMDRILEKADIQPGESVLLYLPESGTDAKFSWYLLKYKLFSPNFSLAAEISDPAAFEIQIDSHDHFLLGAEDDISAPFAWRQK